MGGCSPAQVLAALGVSTATVAPQDAPLCTDMGNARRLAARHGADLRYSESLGWLVYSGTHWAPDDTGEVMRRAKDAALALLREAPDCPDDDQRAKLAKWAVASQSAAKLNAAKDLARSEPGLAVSAEAFDRDPLLFNCLSGTLDLRTVTLRPHRRDDLLTRCVPVTFDLAAVCPRWLAFLARVVPDPEVRAFLQRWWGYCLSGLTVEQVMLILWGTGANGKSVMLAVLQHVLGPYAAVMDFATLAAKRNEGGPRNDLARLRGVRLACAIEAGAGKRFDEPTVKTLTGSDPIACRFLYRETFQHVPTCKVVVAANHRPTVSADGAMWRRLLLAPFPVVIPPEERDPHLTDTLKAEASGILNWLVDGWRAYQAGGLQVPEAMRAAVAEYRSAEDTLAGFLEECTAPGGAVLHKDLYAAYQAWAARAGEEPETGKKFGHLLNDRGIRQDRRGPRGAVRRLGICLREGCERSEAISVTLPSEPLMREVTQIGSDPSHPSHPSQLPDVPAW